MKDNDEFTDAEKAAITRWLAVAADHRVPLRIVHDPDTGCEGGDVCKFYDDHRRMCALGVDTEPFPRSGTPAPQLCPLRAGDVVVSARKGGT